MVRMHMIMVGMGRVLNRSKRAIHTVLRPKSRKRSEEEHRLQYTCGKASGSER